MGQPDLIADRAARRFMAAPFRGASSKSKRSWPVPPVRWSLPPPPSRKSFPVARLDRCGHHGCGIGEAEAGIDQQRVLIIGEVEHGIQAVGPHRPGLIEALIRWAILLRRADIPAQLAECHALPPERQGTPASGIEDIEAGLVVDKGHLANGQSVTSCCHSHFRLD